MNEILTQQERDTLDTASAIIVAHTPTEQANWSIAFHSGGMHPSACYFDSMHNQHMLWGVKTLSEAVQRGMDLEARIAADPDAAKSARIAFLKAQLADLGEVLA